MLGRGSGYDDDETGAWRCSLALAPMGSSPWRGLCGLWMTECWSPRRSTPSTDRQLCVYASRRVVNGRSAVERQSHRKGGATAGWAV